MISLRNQRYKHIKAQKKSETFRMTSHAALKIFFKCSLKDKCYFYLLLERMKRDRERER